MLSSDIHVRSDAYRNLSTMGVQNRKRKQVVSLSLSVPASKRLFLSPMSDEDLHACHGHGESCFLHCSCMHGSNTLKLVL